MTKQNSFHFNTIEEAIEDIRKGKIIIVTDDADRENEGDFLAAAETITPEIVGRDDPDDSARMSSMLTAKQRQHSNPATPTKSFNPEFY